MLRFERQFTKRKKPELPLAFASFYSPSTWVISTSIPSIGIKSFCAPQCGHFWLFLAIGKLWPHWLHLPWAIVVTIFSVVSLNSVSATAASQHSLMKRGTTIEASPIVKVTEWSFFQVIVLAKPRKESISWIAMPISCIGYLIVSFFSSSRLAISSLLTTFFLPLPVKIIFRLRAKMCGTLEGAISS
jgi:hypothetical protein